MTKKFINFVAKECKKHGVTLTLSPDGGILLGSTKCNGYFDENSLELAVATGKEEEKWLQTLAHEYCHMTQWVEDCKAWRDFHIGTYDSEGIIDLWLSNEIELNPRQLIRHISKARNVETDCERRTIRLIVEYGLPLDIKKYAQGANSYLFFWTLMKITRKWYKIGMEPYNIPEIVEAMPTHILAYGEYENIDPYVDLYFEYMDLQK